MQRRLIWAIACVLLPGMASAYPVTGSRSSANKSEIVVNPTSGGWINGNLKVGWDVRQGGVREGYQEIVYTYTILADSRNLSHFILEVSEGIEYGEGKDIYDATLKYAYTDGSKSFDTPIKLAIDTYSPGLQGKSNPGLPATMYGAKFDTPSMPKGKEVDVWELSFTSIRGPRWGNFYAKDGKLGGKDVYGYNTSFVYDWVANGLNLDRLDVTSTDPGYRGFIVTPDSFTVAASGPSITVVAVPEPSTLAIAGLGALGFLGHGLRRRLRA